jgi:eukaryotic-like serine/threonine-protein kinase
METKCPQCGAVRPLDEEWEQNLCPACLMKLGLSGAIPAIAVPEPDTKATPASPRSRFRWDWRWAGMIAGAVAALALIVVAALHFMERPEPKAVIHFNFEPPEDMDIQDFAVSPDGRSLAYTATAANGEPVLSVRPFDVLESRVIPGSEGAAMPFWSPDSRSVAFFAGGKLKTVRIDGPPPITIADVPQPRGGTWNTDGGILFASGTHGVLRVPSVGGEATKVIEDSPRELVSQRWPQFLPDGRHFLFAASGQKSGGDVVIGDLASGEKRVLIQGSPGGGYADGHLLFLREGMLMRQPFDTNRLELTGEPRVVPYAQSIGSSGNRALQFSAGGNVLAYRAGEVSTERTLLWMDRRGEILKIEQKPIEQGFALSPDFTSVAVSRRASRNQASDLWVRDLARGAETRLTFDARGASSPVWSPDGTQIAFIANAQAETEFLATSTKAPGKTEMLLTMKDDAVLESWSPDGRVLLFTARSNDRLSVWTLAIEGRKPVAYLGGNFNYKQARFSPDNRWVVYVSDESGRDEVYVREFLSGEIRSMVSIDGGSRPAWRRDGREIFYLSPHKELVAVSVEFAAPLRVGRPQVMWKMPPGAEDYEVMGDGQRFLIAAPAHEHQRLPINVILNWSEEK